jgi:hypothetical protein
MPKNSVFLPRVEKVGLETVNKPQVLSSLDLIAKTWPESDSVYDLTAIDIR